MDFNKLIEQERILQQRKNFEEVKKQAKNKNKDLIFKINNFIKTQCPDWTEEEIINDILADDRYAIKLFSKDPLKQNLAENLALKVLNAQKLPQNGKNSVRFDQNGYIVALNSVQSHINVTKSADAYIDGYYATLKYTTNSGGSQDNQRNDVIQFLDKGSINHKVAAFLDGEYWDNHHRDDLKLAFKHNKNVLITSVSEYTSK